MEPALVFCPAPPMFKGKKKKKKPPPNPQKKKKKKAKTLLGMRRLLFNIGMDWTQMKIAREDFQKLRWRFGVATQDDSQ